MTPETNGDVGWQRRYRQTDLGAALLFGAAVPAVAHLGWAAAVGMVSAGIALMILYRERRLERVGREIWLIDSWWFLRPLRIRRRAVQPGRVVLTLPESGWLARRRTLLTVDGHEGSILLERWRHESERLYPMQLVTALGRWLGVRASGVLAPSDNRPDAPELRAALRASLDSLTGLPGDAKRAAPLPYRLLARRPAWKVALYIWVLLVGVGLMCLSRLTYLGRGIDVFALVAALPLGTLLATYGLAGALPGRIRTEILPSGLHVERLGLRRDVLLHIPFANVTWVGSPTPGSRRPKPTLQVGCGDAFANLTAGRLGLTTDAFDRFCGVYRRALADWLDRHLDAPTAGAGQVAPPRPPTGPVELDDRRAAPNSVVTVFAQLAPRLSVVLVGAFVVALFLLSRGPAYPVMRKPVGVQPEAAHFLPFFGLKVLLFVAGFAAAGAAMAIVIYLFWSAPPTAWTYALLIPMASTPILAFMGGLEGLEVAECWNVCAGAARPARYRLRARGNAVEYGPSRLPGRLRRNHDGTSWVDDFNRETDLIEVDGVLGGKYLLAGRDYHATCDAWRAHLPSALLRKESEP